MTTIFKLRTQMGICCPKRIVPAPQHGVSRASSVADKVTQRHELTCAASSSAVDLKETKPETIWLLRPRDLQYVPTGTVVWAIDGERMIAGIDTMEEETRQGYLPFGLACSKWTREELGRLLDVPPAVERAWWKVG